MELLDPDPPARAGGRAWERRIGIVLVLAVVGWGLSQWWSASTEITAYRAGVRAETAGDWEAALPAYRRAGGYGDAAARVTRISGIITARDGAYQTAESAVRRSDWGSLIPALALLRGVGPTYRDTAHFAQVLDEQVYTPALSGTVALFAGAQPPGWYTYRPGGRRWLSGSDAKSVIAQRCPDGGWLLDIPAAALPPGVPTPAASGGAQGLGRLQGRRFAVVNADGSPRVILDARMNGSSWTFCDARQVWNMHYVERVPHPSSGYAPAVFTATYQVFTATQAQTPVLPGPDWFVHFPTADGTAIWVVDTTGVTAANYQTHLYRSAPDGSNRRAVGTFAGRLYANDTTPDGHYGLLMLDNSSAAGTTGPVNVELSVVLIDLQGTQPPQTLATLAHSRNPQQPAPELVGMFLQRPPYRGQILLLQSDGTNEQVGLLDPAHLGPIRLRRLPQRSYGGFYVKQDDQGGLLITGQANGTDSSAGLVFTYIDRAFAVHQFQAADLTYSSAPLATLHDGRLVYTDAQLYQSPQGEQPANVYSLPLTAFDTPGVQPSRIYSGTHSADYDPAPAQPWAAGGAWLAYVTPNGDLHARHYDGSGDVTLEHGVRGFAWPYDSPFGSP